MDFKFLNWISSDLSDVAFRWAFSSIFLGLGLEHLFADATIQLMMPGWIVAPRLISVLCGCILVFGGTLVFLGYQLRFAALLLSVFLLAVTAVVHAPGLVTHPQSLPENWHWLWDVLQRSNFVKNLCLLGSCLRFFNYQTGRYSLENYIRQKYEGRKVEA